MFPDLHCALHVTETASDIDCFASDIAGLCALREGGCIVDIMLRADVPERGA